MFRYALKSLRANATRLVATAVAVVVGIGFLAAGLMLTDAVQAGLTGTADQRYQGIDLAVTGGGVSAEMGFRQGIPAETLEQIRNTEGVAAADGETAVNVRLRRDDGTSVSLRTQGRSWISDDQLNPLTLIEGNAPVVAGEVVIDRGLAGDAGVGVGDEVTLQTPIGLYDATVVGISEFGRSAAIDDGGTISFPQDEALEVFGSTAGYSAVLVRTDDDPSTVARVLESTLPGMEVFTRDAFIEDATRVAEQIVSFLRPVLQGFAYLALFVAAFVIFNTFSVVVVQRFRELALIRAVGGTPAQVRRSLLVEGLGIGLAASAVGLVAGALIALFVQWVLGRFDVVLPGAGVKVTVWTVVLCMVAGTVVTVLSVLVPAFRAGRTKPVEAMRSSAVDTSGTSVVRAVIGGAFLVLSIIFLTINQVVNAAWYWIAPGGLFLFLGVFVGGPLLARLFAIVASPVMRRMGMTGRLAADNSVRNPRRTSTTSNALVIGLFLVTLVTVSGEALKVYAVGELNKRSSSDFVVASIATIPEELVAAIDGIDGVSATAPLRQAQTVDEWGMEVFFSAGDLDDLAETAGISELAGDIDAITSGVAMAVPDMDSALGIDSGGAPMGLNGEQVGYVYRLRAADGSIVEVPVEAIVRGQLDSLFIGPIVSDETLETLVGEQPVNMVFVRTEPGRADAVGPEIERALGDYTGVEVLPGNFIGQIVSTVFDFLIGAVNGLLGMSVLVALVGIVNTMTLAIFERRRELGMVRALGMTRQQVGRMVRAEAVLIGLLGTVVGVGSGVLLSWVVVSSLGDIGLSFNWIRVVLIFAVGVAVGVVASILPARRATRLDMLEAMKEG